HSLSLHDALPIYLRNNGVVGVPDFRNSTDDGAVSSPCVGHAAVRPNFPRPFAVVNLAECSKDGLPTITTHGEDGGHVFDEQDSVFPDLAEKPTGCIICAFLRAGRGEQCTFR